MSHLPGGDAGFRCSSRGRETPPPRSPRRVPAYAKLCPATSAGFLIAAFAYPEAGMSAVAACFAVAVGLACPVGTSNRRLGLMEGDGSLASPGRQRMDLLSASCRWHPGAYLGCIVATVLLVGGLFLVPGVGHPGLGFAAGIAALPGCWFWLVEPVAEELHAKGWRGPLRPDGNTLPAMQVREKPAGRRQAEAAFWFTCSAGGAVLAVLPGLVPFDLQVVQIVFGLLLAARFVSAYTDVGLNHDERRHESARRRWKRLAAASSWWPGILWVSAALPVGLLLLAEAGWAPPADAFLAVLAGLSLLSGLWFLLVHDTAKRLMAEELEAQRENDPRP